MLTLLAVPCRTDLRKLVIHTPDCPSSSTTTTTSSSSSSSRLSSQPVWLWLQPKAWASKLTCLELRGVPLSDTTAISLQQLTGLHRLAIQGCRLPPSAVERLLQQLAHCKHLTALLLCGNDMWLMPKLGWEAVAGLQVCGGVGAGGRVVVCMGVVTGSDEDCSARDSLSVFYHGHRAWWGLSFAHHPSSQSPGQTQGQLKP